MELWKIHYCHLNGVIKNGRNHRTRYDPLLIKWAIALLAKTSHSIYEEIAKLIQLPALSYVLRKNKEIVGEQGVTGYNGVHVKHIQSLHTVLVIDNCRIHGVISFDEMKIKDGIAWDINSTRIIGVDPQLSFDVITNEFKTIANSSDDHSNNVNNSPTIDQINLSKNHIVFKFAPSSPELRKHGFIVSSESVSKCNAGRLANILNDSNKCLATYNFDVIAVCSDGATENVSLFEGLGTESIQSFVDQTIIDSFPRIDFDYKCVGFNAITEDPIFL